MAEERTDGSGNFGKLQAKGHIYLLDIYLKTVKEDLTPDEIKQLRALIKEWLDE